MSVILSLVEDIKDAMDFYFNADAVPYGGRTGPCRHRGGALVALDGFPEPGDVVDLGDCPTLAFVNVLRQYPTMAFPDETQGVAICGAPRVVLAQLGVARCSTAFSDDGPAGPSEDRLEFEADRLLDDANRLYAAACRAAKCADDHDLIDAHTVGAWTPVGPEGGVVSGVLEVSFMLTRGT